MKMRWNNLCEVLKVLVRVMAVVLMRVMDFFIIG